VTAPRRVLAEADCERCREGRWLTQPVNTASSLAYVAVGAALVRRADAAGSPAARTRAHLVALALAGLSVGSVAYHGPGGPVSHRLHDASIVAAALFLAAGDVAVARGGPPPGSRHLAGAAAVGLVACGPRTSLAAQEITGAVGAVADGLAWRAAPPGSRSRRLRGLAAVAWAVGAAAQATGRTGGPLCRPDSVLQVHGAWHVISAVALGLTAQAQIEADAEAPGERG